MAITSFTKCICDKCKREQIFDSWQAAATSAWRQVDIEPLGGATHIGPAAVLRGERGEPETLRAILCGDCAGGLGINATPPKPAMEM